LGNVAIIGLRLLLRRILRRYCARFYAVFGGRLEAIGWRL
jgi:hypothetical protein